jgi:hypothetical protein
MRINPYRKSIESTGRIDIDIYSNRKQKVVNVTQKKQTILNSNRFPMAV